MGDDAATPLAEALSGHPELTELNLAGNKLTDSGLSSFAATLLPARNGKLASLHLMGNRFRDEGVIFLSRQLPKCPSLTHLDLCYNDISAAAARALADCLSESPGITYLGVSSFDYNVPFRREQERIQAMLETNRQLPELQRLFLQVFADRTDPVILRIIAEYSDVINNCGIGVSANRCAPTEARAEGQQQQEQSQQQQQFSAEEFERRMSELRARYGALVVAHDQMAMSALLHAPDEPERTEEDTKSSGFPSPLPSTSLRASTGNRSSGSKVGPSRRCSSRRQRGTEKRVLGASATAVSLSATNTADTTRSNSDCNDNSSNNNNNPAFSFPSFGVEAATTVSQSGSPFSFSFGGWGTVATETTAASSPPLPKRFSAAAASDRVSNSNDSD